jgi:hypothetical protein
MSKVKDVKCGFPQMLFVGPLKVKAKNEVKIR